ncbi:MAG: hypothetical protein ABIH11_01420 [Candidatus Altiarchaeota archaeon]
MDVILGIDGLEHDYVTKFGLKNLMQESYGMTDISEFEEPRTIVIWSSFLSGRNREKEILDLGKERMWGFKLGEDDTFFNGKKYVAFDVPGFNSDLDQHKRERQGMKDYFSKKITVEEFDEIVYAHYRKIKQQYLDALDGDYDIVMGYFGAGDVIGHLSFGIESKMRIIYEEFNDLAKTTAGKAEKMLVISDHGMQAVGRFGDHSTHGFWSLNHKAGLDHPKITDFHGIIRGWG